MACGHRAPSGVAPPEGAFPADIPADANGGLCIGRSCADHRGWGPSATNKRHRVYTCALLATTISAYK